MGRGNGDGVFMLRPSKDYRSLTSDFRWEIPPRFNIGRAVAQSPPADSLALIEIDGDLKRRDWTFGEVLAAANRLANGLTALGARRGDRVGIVLAQSAACAISHVAVYRAGLIAVPLFGLFGPEALEYRLSDCGARFAITDLDGLPKLIEIRERLPALSQILVPSGRGQSGTIDFDRLIAEGSDRFEAVDTAAEDPALIIYTSGTTGQPKGALQAHRTLLGHLPGVELPHDFFPQPNDCFWTPADWAWIGGLLDVLLPSWFHGVPVVAHRMAKFDPERAYELMSRFGVRNIFLPPTAAKLMRQAPAPRSRPALRTVASGGETLGAELLDWGRSTFNVTINEFYGQTECNLVVANNSRLFPIKPGSMGRPIPGHEVSVIDGEGQPRPPGEMGTVAIRRPDPVMFLGYWNRPEATAAKFVGDWLVTGDQARLDEDGYLWFSGRDDDLITSSGYRIGPGEIENCLLRHPAVAMVAVVGVPDPVRTEVVKACVVLKPGLDPTDALKAELQQFVRSRLAAHEYPRIVEFRSSLPLTATGKIIRRELRNPHVG
ncbi:MAG TPA: acyl-CoA synthetase [Myxococcaceae bacterium]|nr:acyl-CoA synthetase [Myxococcaceae bacterium]